MEPSEFPTFTNTQMAADSGVNIQPTIMWVASTATNTATGEMRNVIC